MTGPASSPPAPAKLEVDAVKARFTPLFVTRTIVLAGLLAWSLPHVEFTITYWLWYGQHALARTDFGLYYAFSLIGRTSGWTQLYSLSAQHSVYDHLGLRLWWFPLPYTPPIAWIFAPFTLLPMQSAYWIWASILTGAFIGAWWIAAPSALLARAVCLTCAFVPYLTQLGLVLGQWVVVEVLAVALCALALHRSRPYLAGLALAPTVLAPQGLLLLPLALLVGGRWRTVLSWAAVATVLGVASLISLGPHGTYQYVERLLLAQGSPLEFAVDSSIVVPQLIGHHHAAEKVLVEFGVAAVVVLAAWRHRRGPAELLLPIGLIGSMLSSSFLHLDDLMLLIVAAWLVLKVRPGPSTSIPVAAMFLLSLQLGYGSAQLWSTLFVIGEACWLLTLCLQPPEASKRRPQHEPTRPAWPQMLGKVPFARWRKALFQAIVDWCALPRLVR